MRKRNFLLARITSRLLPFNFDFSEKQGTFASHGAGICQHSPRDRRWRRKTCFMRENFFSCFHVKRFRKAFKMEKNSRFSKEMIFLHARSSPSHPATSTR
jgi:hypothetical protein